MIEITRIFLSLHLNDYFAAHFLILHLAPVRCLLGESMISI